MQQFHKFHYLTFMYGITCFERLSAHNQWRLQRCWSWSGRITCQTTTKNAPTATSNGKTRGSWWTCALLMMGGVAPETC